jgi:hypothetical protein
LPPDPHDHHHERSLTGAVVGTVLFCAATGAGIGVFWREPAIGAVVGGLAGIVLGVWLIPALMREWGD